MYKRQVENNKEIAGHESVIRDASESAQQSAKSKWAGLASAVRGNDGGEAAKSGAEDNDD